MSGRRSRTSPARVIGVDVARALAVLAMFVAHTAPVAGPAGVFTMTNYIAAPLFAMVLGAGAQLGWRGGGRYDRYLAIALVRAVVLFVVGLLLVRAGAQIVIVLPWLAVLLVICAVLVRLSTTLIGVVAALLFAAAPAIQSWGLSHLPGTGASLGNVVIPDAGMAKAWLSDLAVTGADYRLIDLTVWAAIGILAMRRWGGGGAGRAGEQLVAGVLALGLAGVLKLVWRGEFLPYDGSHLTLAFSALACVGILALSLAAGQVVGGRALEPFVAVGQMAFSLYVIQVIVLGLWVRSHPTDNTWPTFAGTIIGAFTVALVWRVLVTSGPLRRGPVEGAMALLTSPLR